MYRKSLSVLLAIMMIFTTFSVCNVFAKTTESAVSGEGESFKAGDTVYFDCSTCGAQWTSSYAIEYVNLSQYSREDNGGSVIIAERDTSKYNPIEVTEKISDYVFSYTFTEETAGADSIRFWRGSTEKMWNNSPLLTYAMFKEGKNCIKATDLNGNGSVDVYSTEPAPSPFEEGLKLTYAKSDSLFVHGVSGNTEDTDAWQMWQEVDGIKYFFLPSSTDSKKVDVYNTFKNDVTIGSSVVPAGDVASVSFDTSKTYTLNIYGNSYKLRFMRSGAECAVYVNNADMIDGKDLYNYLCENKENSAKATGVVTESNGTIKSTPIKKIKGRGNTSWGKDKKSFNITYDSALEIAGMDKTKKYSICANYQDDTLSRNRILYDLGDEVGIPYNSDSRYADFYMNGRYMGSYQMCQKIEVGSNALIGDLSGKEYINEDGSLAGDFSFALKVDSGVDPDDFAFRAGDNSLIVISPELTGADKYYNEVKNYISTKFNEMYTALKGNSATLKNLIDIDSYAKMYLINELGKNWDAGASSFYFVYKPDDKGNYKFFAAPTWDYDNSLGNCVGVDFDLSHINVTDYTEPTGLFVTYKGGRKSTSNVASLMYRNTEVKERIAQVWYESFVPVIEYKLKGKGINSGELYSADVYYNLIKDSAAMNYTSGWLMNPEPQWLSDHSKLNISTFDYKTKAYSEKASVKNYNAETFEGVYNFCTDWLYSRSAYLSNLFVDSYIEPVNPVPPTEPEKPEEPEIKEHEIAEGTIAEFWFDNNGKAEGDKLTEYGDKNGYKATFGQADLLLSMSGEGGRALEWSAAEYTATGDQIVPIMGAGSKNPWGEKPFIQVSMDATGCSDMSFSIDVAGSKKAPANWKMQYSTDGENFIDISDTDFTITVDNRKILTNYINVKLPSDCDNAEKLTIRLIPTSTTTVEGGVYTDTPTSGEIAVNNIVIKGNTTKTGIKGDLNLDGVLQVNDAAMLQKYLMKTINLTSTQKAVADFTANGKVDIKDVTAIQKALVE